MDEPFTKPARRVRLDFRDHDALDHADQPARSDLSAAATHGRSSWVSNDELATVERLIRQGDGSYAQHQPIDLAELFDLPEGADGEMDIEGLDVADGCLWIVGSHSLTREKPKPGEHDPAEALARLTEIKHQPNRHFLGRVPLIESAEHAGVFDVGAQADDPAPGIGALKTSAKGSRLDTLLRDDVHIARFMGVPAKENGFDVEGIAARGDRVFLGLRGPVLRGWAMLLELELKTTRSGRLKPRRIGSDGTRYAKHFLDLQGLAIRDLLFDGDALLVLAGPTMDLDGPVTLYRWPAALDATDQRVVPGDELELVLHLPFGRGGDHAEGICWLPDRDGTRELLVVYDSPAAHRLQRGTAIAADVFALPAGGDSARRR